MKPVCALLLTMEGFALCVPVRDLHVRFRTESNPFLVIEG